MLLPLCFYRRLKMKFSGSNCTVAHQCNKYFYLRRGSRLSCHIIRSLCQIIIYIIKHVFRIFIKTTCIHDRHNRWNLPGILAITRTRVDWSSSPSSIMFQYNGNLKVARGVLKDLSFVGVIIVPFPNHIFAIQKISKRVSLPSLLL